MTQAERSFPVDEARMSRAVFDKISQLAHKEAGLVLAKSKQSMMESRLRKRLIHLDIPSFEAYCVFLESPEGRSEMTELISALTTNVSHFFREEHHFDQLAHKIVPLIQEKIRQGGKGRIWSAGCSNGQEPYSIAMTILETAPELAKADFRILASDVDRRVLQTAKTGLFDERMINGLSPKRMSRFGQKTAAGWQISHEVRSLVAFRYLNLIESWPMKGLFDVIFCRNVVIYFDVATQAQLWQRFTDILVPGGTLFAGHSERVTGPAQKMVKPDGMTAYRKTNHDHDQNCHAKGAKRWA